MAQNENGPSSYENWKAALNGEELQWTLEFPLYTDAHIIANALEGYGPYQFLNTDPMTPDSRSPLRPAIVLRFDDYRTFEVKDIDLGKTDYRLYHGGELTDEIAALVSLCLGIRVKCGQITRRFDPNSKDVRGQPTTHLFDNNPTLPQIYGRPILPKVREQRSLHDISLIAKYNHLHLDPEQAAILVKSARLYQEALWISEASPEISWLLLTSAIETAANLYYNTREETEESILQRMDLRFPKLRNILVKVGHEALVQVAEHIAGEAGIVEKFRDFIEQFRPNPPLVRPPVQFQLSWVWDELRKSLNKVYTYRSIALHSGIPFPAPMCESPYIGDKNDEPQYAEIPIGSTRMKGSTWRRKDMPMLLQTFEYIVRNSLLNWWRSMVAENTGIKIEEENDR